MSSKRHQRRKQCGKVAYATREEAGKNISWAWRTSGQKLAIYKCQFCGSFHIGHLPGKQRRAASDRKRAAARRAS